MVLHITDEIIKKFAAIMDDFPVPAPTVPKSEELSSVEPELPESKPIDLPKPISIRDKIDEPSPGTAEWAAKYHTQEFLRGVKQPYRGWIRQPENKALVEQTMEKLVHESPENYFSWDLHRRPELLSWLYPAAVSLIKKDPITALVKEIYRFKELKDLQTDLWKAVLGEEISRSVFDPKSSGKIFQNKLFNQIRHLAGLIAESDPEFYWLYIEGKPITTKQFDETARRILKQKEELGKTKPIKLPYKTKL